MLTKCDEVQENQYFHIFKVRGRGAFPLDMLRQDQCYPLSTTDALSITNTYTWRELTFAHWSYHNTWLPTASRWDSFGWSVVPFEDWYKKA